MERGGYFGKLPAKADFVTGTCPQGFMRLWEPFLMQGLAQSRQDLQDVWEEAYMTMPVWRFWMMPLASGTGLEGPMAGAVMPSVDRVGREFPLTIVFPASGEERPGADWYEAVEAVLLDALEDDATLSGFRSAVSGLKPPGLPADEPGEGLAEAPPERGAPVLKAGVESAGAVRSEFWCVSGERHYAFDCSGLPQPGDFRWLMLPETWRGRGGAGQGAGTTHGRYHAEGHRT